MWAICLLLSVISAVFFSISFSFRSTFLSHVLSLFASSSSKIFWSSLVTTFLIDGGLLACLEMALFLSLVDAVGIIASGGCNDLFTGRVGISGCFSTSLLFLSAFRNFVKWKVSHSLTAWEIIRAYDAGGEAGNFPSHDHVIKGSQFIIVLSRGPIPPIAPSKGPKNIHHAYNL